MAKVIMLVGVPGSGKSYDAARMEGAIVVSSDQMRIARGGDQTTHTRDRDFWDDVRAEVVKHIQADEDVVLDATNVDPEWREFNVRFFLEHKASEVIVRLYDTDLETCLERNASRQGPARIEERVVRNMFRQLKTFPPEVSPGGISRIDVVKP